jgi:LPLT family lysophospholipid transporter-like MFS transporter
MNALLQHRGHNLMGAGRSIAVQNFNEQACILAWARSTAWA